jgi:hypothetical protein
MQKKQIYLKDRVNLYLFRTTIDQYEKNSVLTVRKVERPDTGRYRYINDLIKTRVFFYFDNQKLRELLKTLFMMQTGAE